MDYSSLSNNLTIKDTSQESIIHAIYGYINKLNDNTIVPSKLVAYLSDSYSINLYEGDVLLFLNKLKDEGVLKVISNGEYVPHIKK